MPRAHATHHAPGTRGDAERVPSKAGEVTPTHVFPQFLGPIEVVEYPELVVYDADETLIYQGKYTEEKLKGGALWSVYTPHRDICQKCKQSPCICLILRGGDHNFPLISESSSADYSQSWSSISCSLQKRPDWQFGSHQGRFDLAKKAAAKRHQPWTNADIARLVRDVVHAND